VRKIQKSAAFDFKDGGMSPHTSAAQSKTAIVTDSAAHIDKQLIAQGSADNVRWSLYKPISPHSRSNSRLFSTHVRTDIIAVPRLSKVSTASTTQHANTRDIVDTSPTDLSLAALVEASPDKQTLGSDSNGRHQEDWTDDADDANNDSRVIDEERLLSFSHSDDKPITSTAVPDEGKGMKYQWLSAAMESASLKDDNLAYSQVQGVMSSTPATSMSSWGSLFLKRSPRVAVVGWSHSPLPKVSPHTWSSVRSAEMPAPMLTGPVDEELRMSRSTKDQSTKEVAQNQIPERRNYNEELIEHIYQDGKLRTLIDFIKIDIDYRSKTRKNRTALMAAAAQGRRAVVYTLFKAAFTREKWPTLSMLDDNGDTISTLSFATNANCSRQLNEVLRLFVAVACCECGESTRRSSICGRLARKGFLAERELKSTEPGCRWGRKLCCLEWPCQEREWNLDQTRTSAALEEIDARIEELKACDTTRSDFRAARQRMLSEWVRCEVFFRFYS
jgi:hypothetical protein